MHSISPLNMLVCSRCLRPSSIIALSKYPFHIQQTTTQTLIMLSGCYSKSKNHQAIEQLISHMGDRNLINVNEGIWIFYKIVQSHYFFNPCTTLPEISQATVLGICMYTKTKVSSNQENNFHLLFFASSMLGLALQGSVSDVKEQLCSTEAEG